MGCEIKEHFYTAEKEGKATLELTKGAAYGRLESPGFIIAETYPAYPTDAQSIILPLLATAKGNTLVADRIFPERFGAAEELVKMGADIQKMDYGQIVKGKRRLKGAEVYSHDLRAGAAMIIAGLSASAKQPYMTTATSKEDMTELQKNCAGSELKSGKFPAEIRIFHNATVLKY